MKLDIKSFIIGILTTVNLFLLMGFDDHDENLTGHDPENSNDTPTQKEVDAAEAAKIREELKHPQLAEGVMAIGYVHYCRACRVLNSKDAESVVDRISFMEESYSKALDQYKKSLNLYLDTVGPEHTDVG